MIRNEVAVESWVNLTHCVLSALGPAGPECSTPGVSTGQGQKNEKVGFGIGFGGGGREPRRLLRW
jgi:hypothetical protein